jgi:hypothetical protein
MAALVSECIAVEKRLGSMIDGLIHVRRRVPQRSPTRFGVYDTSGIRMAGANAQKPEQGNVQASSCRLARNQCCSKRWFYPERRGQPVTLHVKELACLQCTAGVPVPQFPEGDPSN